MKFGKKNSVVCDHVLKIENPEGVYQVSMYMSLLSEFLIESSIRTQLPFFLSSFLGKSFREEFEGQSETRFEVEEWNPCLGTFKPDNLPGNYLIDDNSGLPSRNIL